MTSQRNCLACGCSIIIFNGIEHRNCSCDESSTGLWKSFQSQAKWGGFDLIEYSTLKKNYIENGIYEDCENKDKAE